MRPEDFFSFDPDSGEWRNNTVGYRFVLLGEPFYINMMINLSKQFGSAAGVFMYQGGLGVGQEMGKLVKNALDPLTGYQHIIQEHIHGGLG